MTATVTVWLLGALLIAALAMFARARLRARAAWQQVFALRKKLRDAESELVKARKELVLSRTADAMRLPPLMPSQHGEDVLLWELFGGKRDGFYVDVGAYDGVGFSNTYFFEAMGWSGVLVEATPDLFDRCRTARPHSEVVQAAAGSRNGTIEFTIVEGKKGAGTLSSTTPDHARIAREGGTTRTVTVPLRTLDDILGDRDQTIDFVSIDVEGAELDVLHGFDLDRYRPQVLIIEENDPADTRVREYLAGRGYGMRGAVVGQNVVYERRSAM